MDRHPATWITAGHVRAVRAWLIVPWLSLAAAAAAVVRDAAPYDRIHQEVEWTAGDGERLAFCLLGRDGEDLACTLAVYRLRGTVWERLYLDRDHATHPWKIMLTELDGDERPEVLVAVRKPSRFDPIVRNRLFVYDWTLADTIHPLWLGSRLGGSLVDFAVVAGGDGLDRVVVAEEAGPGATRARRYAWSGFGFVLDEDDGEE